jgi:uncharacterized protein YuzE
MREVYLEVTFRKGRAFAAYLYLPRGADEASVRTERHGKGLLVDYGADGRPIGVEISAPGQTSPADVNAILDKIGIAKLGVDELAPLSAA